MTTLPPLPGFGMRGMGGVYGGVQVTVTQVDFDPTTGLPDGIGIAAPKSHHLGLIGTALPGFAFDLADPFTFHGFRLWLGFVFGMPLDRAVTPVDWFASPRSIEGWAGDTIARMFDQPLNLEAHNYLNALYTLQDGQSQMDRICAAEPVGRDRLPRVLMLRQEQWDLIWKRNPKHLERAIYIAAVERP